ALGIKMARPDELVVAAVGDGSYMFGNPTPAHYVAKAYDLPVLFVVFDNAGWEAVDRATRGMYPDGDAVKQNVSVFSQFDDPPDYTMVAAASGAHTATATTPQEAMTAIAKAARVVREEKRQAMVRIICQG
ncbi:MAG: thiamine pyrophosphate-dependent enzyme, partial [Alphaproteobacteria bacterium]|nr:thiamine pyrophosphate-dependent enzyme [Alphaproteobacteria bacterium]